MAKTLLNVISEFQDPFMVGVVRKFMEASLFMARLTFIPVDGMSFGYGEESSLGGIYYRPINEDYPTGAYSVVNPKVEPMAIFGGEARTDMQLANKHGGAARANEIARRIRRAGLFYDKELIKGDSSTDPKAMTGLYRRLTGNQLITNSANGAPVAYEKVNELIDAVYGKNEQKLLIMNKVARRLLKYDLAASASGTGIQELGGSLSRYDGVEIAILDEDENEDPILAFNETCGTSSTCTSILCVHLGDTTDREGLQGLVGSQGVERHDAGCKGTYYLDVVEMHAGVGLFKARAAARLQGITAS